MGINQFHLFGYTNIYYKNPLLNSEGTEYFPLNNSTLGSRGTKPYSIAGESYEKDIAVTDAEVKQKRVLTTNSSTKILYDLGLKQSQGTMGVWFNTKGGATNRYILASEGNGSLLTTYLDSNSKLNLAVRNSSGSWLTLITSTDIITLNTWNYAAFTWSVSGTTLNVKLYLNDKVYSGSTTSFKDFTGAKTAIGGTVSGSNQLNGQLEGLTYYNTELSSEEISQAYTAGRGNKVNYKYDAIGRVTDRTLNTGVIDFITKYSFETGKTVGSVVNTTTKVKEIDNNGNKIAYTYDPNGNIATITENGKVINYTYDQLNQLTREDNQVLNKTITYSYDAGGNILSKTEYAYTTGDLGAPTSTIIYGYTDSNWKDKLTSFDGKAITYDAIGNPLTYDGYTFTWEQGRQLADINGNGKDVSFKYNVNGIRTEKTVNGVTTKYHLAGDIVTLEENGTDKIYYTYDSEDNLVSMNLNGVEYYYIRNAQGDIIGLFDKNGATVASYTYDSWGKLISIKDGSGTDITNNTASVGYKNPYRYRGYRYDTENGLYYLQSRYYNPEWSRFINADTIVGEVGELLSHNMFAYCNNDPVNMEDPDGDIAWWVGAAIGGALFDSAVYLFQHRNEGFSWSGLGKAATTGALTGVAFAGAGKFVAKGARAIVSSRKAKAIAKAACFTEDTPVLTKDGSKPIKDVKVGDDVYSENPETGEKGLKKVTKVFVNETDKLIHLYVDGEEIKTTSEHPFWVVDEGWVGAEDLRAGDKVLLYSGKIVEIEQVTVEQLDDIIKVYNFEVEDWHTYFVSEKYVLVHNMCAALRKIVESSSAQRAIKKLSPEAKKGYSKAIEALKSGDTRGLNEHALTGSRKGQWAVDIKGMGKGRGKGRVIFTKESNGSIKIIEILTNHDY